MHGCSCVSNKDQCLFCAELRMQKIESFDGDYEILFHMKKQRAKEIERRIVSSCETEFSEQSDQEFSEDDFEDRLSSKNYG